VKVKWLVDDSAESSTDSYKSLIYKDFSTTRHSHSIVNRLVPLIGKTGRASAEHRLDTDKSTVAFDGSAHGSFASISGVDRLRQGLDGENGMS
jgi:hypothetical protein